MFVTALFCLFVLSVAIQLGYFFYFFVRIFSLPAKTQAAGTPTKPVTIIICAKNEARNLQQNLPAILTQRYSNASGKALYEVIVVNDGSTDDTASVLQSLEQQYDHLWDIVMPADAQRTLKGKKFALSKGIEHASHDLLLLTDADCQPASDQWLQQMVQPLIAGKEIAAGYGGFYTTRGWLNTFNRWETMHTFLQFSTYALAGTPYMAVGRNLACTKTAVQEAQKAKVWNALPSGDDDLLVDIVANAHNMTIVCDSAAFTWSAAKATFKEWVSQKQRHLSTGKYYKPGRKALLSIYASSHAAMWLLFALLAFLYPGSVLFVLVAVRCLLYWITWAFTSRRLQEKKLTLLFPLLDVGWMIYNFAFSPYIIWKTKKQWK